MAECADCKHYKGNCGHHFVDWNGHINYEIPDEDMERFCFEPSAEFLEKQKEEHIKRLISEYTAEEIEEAVKKLKEVSEDGERI